MTAQAIPSGRMGRAPGHGDDVAIRTSGLGKRYGATVALAGLNLAVSAGEVYGYLGPNGAGKTTTIRLVLGLQRPSEGDAAIFGIDAWRDPVAAHRRVAFVAGEPMLWPALTGLESLEFLSRLRGGVDEAYRRTLIDRFEFDPRKRVRDYSKGNRQKIQLIAAFAARPDLLVLDEPTSGLDPLMEAAFRDTVAEAKTAGQAVFLSSHILSEVEALCDRVGILREGRLVEEGTLADLRHLSARVVEATFDGPPPDLALPDGVTSTPVGESAVRFDVRGPVGPLIDRLAGTGLIALVSREPTLEELFLAHYDRGGEHARIAG
jgi:polyether ionophore transport system ATP-binding protein